ncbi:MAG: preprotein translocase subunit SecG [Hyphomonadaceae bacterium]
MQNILLTIHIIACIALVIAVMLQRSEGGALGMSGGGTGGLISGRGAAGVLVKVTMGLAIVFFCTSIGMTFLNNQANSAPGVLERQIQQDNSSNPLGSVTTPTTPSTADTQPAEPAPAPAIDPLAPSTAPTTTPPATNDAAPTTPAESGGSNN